MSETAIRFVPDKSPNPTPGIRRPVDVVISPGEDHSRVTVSPHFSAVLDSKARMKVGNRVRQRRKQAVDEACLRGLRDTEAYEEWAKTRSETREQEREHQSLALRINGLETKKKAVLKANAKGMRRELATIEGELSDLHRQQARLEAVLTQLRDSLAEKRDEVEDELELLRQATEAKDLRWIAEREEKLIASLALTDEQQAIFTELVELNYDRRFPRLTEADLRRLLDSEPVEAVEVVGAA